MNIKRLEPKSIRALAFDNLVQWRRLLPVHSLPDAAGNSFHLSISELIDLEIYLFRGRQVYRTTTTTKKTRSNHFNQRLQITVLFGKRNNWLWCAYRVQFSRYKIFNDTVISQMFSTVFWRASNASDAAAPDSVTLSLRDDEIRWRFVEASVRCCIVDAPPSIAKNKNEPSNV